MRYWFHHYKEDKVYDTSWVEDTIDFAYWNIGNCHRTKEDARKWGETYAQYFLPHKE